MEAFESEPDRPETFGEALQGVVVGSRKGWVITQVDLNERYWIGGLDEELPEYDPGETLREMDPEEAEILLGALPPEKLEQVGKPDS